MHFDLLIIGTGAGGGTLAHAMAATGLNIGIIERGGFLPRERENWDPVAVNTRGRYQADETWLDKHDQPFKPYTHYWVGGNTKVYGAALLRMRRDDFDQVRHFGGVSPAWPIGYDDFEPYYTRAEQLYSVHGRRGADPHEPPSTAAYPFPPLEHEPRMRELYDDLKQLGTRPFPCPLGVRLPAGPTPYRLGLFDGYPDPTQVKADAHVVAIEPALAHRNVTLLHDCRADRLLTDASGRTVTGVIVKMTCSDCGPAAHEHEETITADVIVVACGAINSAALLLRSASAAHPRGLANSSGLVGRHYMCHNNGLFIAYTPEAPNPSAFGKSFGISDFYRGSADAPLPLGLIQQMGRMDADSLAGLAQKQLPDVDIGHLAAHCLDFFITAEDLPDPDNRVELAADGRIRVVYTENNLEAYTRLESNLKQLVAAVERRRGEARLHASATPGWRPLRHGPLPAFAAA
jgi:choline dehydrogenase-like flavoprotein